MDIVVTGRHMTVSDRFRAHIEEARESPSSSPAPDGSRSWSVMSGTVDRPSSATGSRSPATPRVPWCGPRRASRTSTQLSTWRSTSSWNGSGGRTTGGRCTAEDDPGVGRPGHGADRDARARRRVRGRPDDGDQFGDSPVEVREKVHRSAPMTLADALREMELVGHDFYLFHDVETDRASVVYRRQGWSSACCTWTSTARWPMPTRRHQAWKAAAS